jgi:glutamine synthetase type III
LNSIKSITQNLSDMNKFLDDISEYKIVDRLKEKLQESENLKMEIEAILIKRVFIDPHMFRQWKPL